MRPGVWVDGNMHASELCGSSAALAIAEDAIRLHTHPAEELHGLPAHVRERLRGVLFHILPRMSPDGAEAVLKTGRYVRSVPRDDRPNRNHARWQSQDVDGDGLQLVMRKLDPGGEFVESSEARGLMLERQLEDPGPYYKVYPEGVIENFDGVTIPTPSFLSDNQPDLNRNFPFEWHPEHEQIGAGAFPMSEPESRAVVEAASRRPHLFAWLNFHTFGGVFIRPLGDKPDSKMDQDDLALFRQIAAWCETCTGYPTVSGFEEFTYEPDKPIRGDLSEYAYHQRGCIAFAVELWDLFERVGFEKKKRFVDRYTHFERADMVKLAKWDAEHNAGRVLAQWKKFRHPQLGEVEVGGLRSVPRAVGGIYARGSARAKRGRRRLAPDSRRRRPGAPRRARGESGLPRDPWALVGEEARVERAARRRDHDQRLLAREPARSAPGGRPPRRLGARQVRGERRALLHAQPRQHRRQDAVVDAARQGTRDGAGGILPHRLDHPARRSRIGARMEESRTSGASPG